MTASVKTRFSGNEKSIEELQQEILIWNKTLHQASEEIIFLEKYLLSDIFESHIPDFFEKIQLFKEQLGEFHKGMRELNVSIHNHRYDIEGMLECEDVSCDTFYLQEHQKLISKLEEFLRGFQNLKLEIFSYTGSVLKAGASKN